MKTIKVKLVSLLLVVGFILPVNANAFFFQSMIEGMTSVSNNMVDGATEVSVEMLKLFEALADDIGEMADRILVMADKIGEMADRIVETEKIMASMATDIAAIRNGQGTTGSEASVLIISSQNGETLVQGQAPVISPSIAAPEYLAYVSSTLAISTTTTAILVHNNAELSAAWSKLEALSQDGNIYIAVRAIDGANISALSNVLTYHTFY